ncbi:hypothetical protein KAI04_00695 [Candidatus Pacearchaeota archaeon]|nr:hypothetical protein [Candidatus Pacearchaeota archaeon]
MADKNKLTVRILVLVIALLALVVLYAFAIRPAVTGYAFENYAEGYQQAQAELLNNILTQIQQTGQAEIPLSEDQVLLLVGEIRQIQPAQPTQ